MPITDGQRCHRRTKVSGTEFEIIEIIQCLFKAWTDRNEQFREAGFILCLTESTPTPIFTADQDFTACMYHA
jgi:hypothetical protein